MPAIMVGINRKGRTKADDDEDVGIEEAETVVIGRRFLRTCCVWIR